METSKFTRLFPDHKPIIAMIHVQPLPGTPRSTLSMKAVAQEAVNEARLYAHAGVQAIMLENMHDIPYLNGQVGPEIIAAMTRVATAVRNATSLPLGVQILAGANQAALAVAHGADLQFIRAEGFVFAHVADEGLINSDAGKLLRYRKALGAENIQIFTDIKKKHSSHALTADVSIAETAQAAEFFLSDGLIITGSQTGKAIVEGELAAVRQAVSLPILAGSGVTPQNLPVLWPHTDGFIVGSYLKKDGNWRNPPDPDRVQALVTQRQSLIS